MKNKYSRRASGRLSLSIAAVFLFAFAGTLPAAIEPPDILYGGEQPLKKAHWEVMNRLIETYGATDWSQVTDHLIAFPDDGGNPNVMVIPLALGNVFVNRYEQTGSSKDYEQALNHFEWVAKKYKVWGKRRLAPTIVHYLVVSVNRLRKPCDDYVDLPRVPRKPITVLWRKVTRLLKAEAEFRLAVDLPSVTFDSCVIENSNAAENARQAMLFAAAANFLLEDAQASTWEEKARQLAYQSIPPPSDRSDKSGVETCTIEQDRTPSNREFAPNDHDSAATLLLLTQGALTYQLTGQPIPDEFTRKVQDLYEKYKSFLSIDLSWAVPTDPEGDGSLFPLVFDSKLEREAIKRKLVQGYLWKKTTPVAVMGTGSDLWEAVQNSKVVLYYLMGSYLWHFPTAACSDELRYTMPVEGSVQ